MPYNIQSQRTATKRIGIANWLSIILLVFVLLAAQSVPPVHAATGPLCYVNASAIGTHDGNSWLNSYTDLQDALTDTNCTTIWVASGVYKPGPSGSRDASFDVRSGVAVYGGFNGTEDDFNLRNPAVNVTILSGDIDSNDAHQGTTNIDLTWGDIGGSNSYHVMMSGTLTSVTASTVLDGFTVTGGDGRGHANGGGFFCNGNNALHECSPTLANLTFSGNAAQSGGAIYNSGLLSGVSSPRLTNVTFHGNRAVNYGGAIYNSAAYSGASSPTLTDVTFEVNSAGTSGGAVYNDGESGGVSSPTFTRVTFNLNNALTYGGAIVNDGSGGTSSPTLTNATFRGNSAGSNGGAMQSRGGGGTSTPTLTNVTFTVNSAAYAGALDNISGNLTLTNVILWGDIATAPYAEIFNANGGTTTISYSVVQGGCGSVSGATCGTGNLSANPLLGTLGNNGGYTQTMPLLTGSPAIDTGNNAVCAAPVNNIDQRGRPRPADGDHNGTVLCDMGAFEVPVFTDMPVAGKEWMEAWVNIFYQHGITTGCNPSPLQYCPENNVTRAEMAIFLLRAKHGGSYTPPAPTHDFADVPVTGKEWMEPWIEQFYMEGITMGCGGGNYCPENNVTRAEMAVFVLRALHGGGDTPPALSHFFSDMPVFGKEWMEPWVDEFKREGITTGCGAGNYCPENSVTRAEMAVFIGRAYHFYP